MNERIRELAFQAMSINQKVSDDAFFVEVSKLKEFEKFAELLLKECMVVTKDYTCNQGWDYSAPVALARHFKELSNER
jgi:hypothetical protein